MASRKTRLLRGLLTVAVLLLLFIVVAVTGYDRGFARRFKRVETGMDREHVIQILGNPESVSSKFFLGQQLGFEAAYARAGQSEAVEYLVWRKGDVVFSVGLNANRRVVVAEVGGT